MATVPLTQPLIGTNWPLVLLPVRLETRFFGADLRVRVYPDKVHVDAHEPQLTDDEVIWGNHFRTAWTQALSIADATQRQEQQRAAWAQLADRCGVTRAAWIKHQLDAQQAPLTASGRTESWTRAPYTKTLPDYWMAFAYQNGTLIASAQGKPIAAQLSVGPDPQALQTDIPQEDDRLPLDAGMQWMVDYDAAERAGMALCVPLPPAATQGIDRLLVLGVKTALDSDTALAELLRAHQYTDDLHILSPGTPTNNTPDIAAGFSFTDPGYEQSYQALFRNPYTPGQDPAANGDLLRLALGLADDTFTGVAQASAHEHAGARDLHTALWASTWGYFLEQMMAGLWDRAVVEPYSAWGRTHFIEYVRPVGPLPALRIGRQPYGILPVSSLSRWQPSPQDVHETGLVTLLKTLYSFWLSRSFTANVPHLGRSGDPTQDLQEVLRTDGLSAGHRVRHVYGRNYALNLWMFLGESPEQLSTAWMDKQREMGLRGLQHFVTLTPDQPPRLTDAIFADGATPLRPDKLPLVQTSVASAPDYIGELLATTNLAMPQPTDPARRTLLNLLLRHAMQLEYAGAATRLLSPPGTPPVAPAEPELIHIEGIASVPTPWQRVQAAEASSGLPFQQWTDTRLQEFRSSLGRLRTLAPATLSHLLRGTLDGCSHRLDAWITSLATKRLTAMRQVHAIGVYLGAYGWVENLRPAAAPGLPLPAPPGDSAPVIQVPGNPGFTQAPSLSQAATVAVLRNGHLTHANDDKHDLLAIDLSSERARLAATLLSGVRAGQPLGALLGYRFERGLHENYAGLLLDRFIERCRQLAPLTATRIDEAGHTVAPVTIGPVVDGLQLFRLWQHDGEQAFLDSIGLWDANKPAEASAVKAEVEALGNAIDAVGDALLAESVHHVVRGNPSRAAATLEALERGAAPPPELEVLRTPRTGTTLTYREIVLFSGAPLGAAGWAVSGTFGFRGTSEPHLNGWAGRLLGNPAHVRIVVEALDTTTGTVLESREMRLNELPLTPLDLVYMADSDGVAASEMEQRIFYHIRRKPGGFAADATLRVNPARHPAWPIRDVSLGEFLELVRTTRRLITGARPLQPHDLAWGASAATATTDVAELQLRSQRAFESLRDIRIKLRAFIAAPAVDKLEPLRVAVLQTSHFGLSGAIPLAIGNTDADVQTLLAQARAVEQEATARLTPAEAINQALNAPGLDADKRQELCLARLHALFGAAFVVLPRFTPSNATELASAFAASTAVQGGDPLAVVTWHQRAARVSEGVACFDDVMRYAEALSTGDALNLQVAQLPYDPNDRWIGLPRLGAKPLPGGRLSLIAHTPQALNTAQPLAGLWLDELLEVVPNDNETTGVVFQYDQPNAVAPQAILLAVPPDAAAPQWTADTLLQVLLETMDLMRIRAVGPEALGELGQYLPALYFAFNARNDTISTDFLGANA